MLGLPALPSVNGRPSFCVQKGEARVVNSRDGPTRGKMRAPTLRLAPAASSVFPIRLATALLPASIIPTSDARDSSTSSP